jgi:hypothetical protein
MSGLEMRLWLGTWNVEQRFPSSVQLQECLLRGKFQCADFLALGFQEAARGILPATVPGFDLIDSYSVKGRTQNRKNTQYLFLYARRDGPLYSSSQVAGHNHHRSDIGAIWKLLPGKEYGKGGMACILKYREGSSARCVAIYSAHLDSKSAAGRAEQVDSILALSFAHQHELDAEFFMGDLNYRLRMDGALSQPVAKEVLYTLFNKDKESLQSLDSILAPGSDRPVDFPAGWKFFPEPRNTPITYKLRYDSNRRHVSHERRDVLSKGESYASHEEYDDAYNFRFDRNGRLARGKRAGVYDLGWLDRIGYRPRWGHAIRLIDSAANLRHAVSDHAFVWALFEL